MARNEEENIYVHQDFHSILKDYSVCTWRNSGISWRVADVEIQCNISYLLKMH